MRTPKGQFTQGKLVKWNIYYRNPYGVLQVVKDKTHDADFWTVYDVMYRVNFDAIFRELTGTWEL